MRRLTHVSFDGFPDVFLRQYIQLVCPGGALHSMILEESSFVDLVEPVSCAILMRFLSL